MTTSVAVFVLICVVLWLLNTRETWEDNNSFSLDDNAVTFDIYVINLDKDTKRLQHFMRFFNNSDLSNYSFTRIPGVDGNKLDVKTLVTTKAYNEITEAELRGHRVKHYQLTRGAVGCYMSHLNTMKTILSSGKDFGIVFEDDVVFNKDLFQQFQKLLQVVPKDWDMLLLGVYCLRCDRVRGFNIVKKFFGMHAYAVRNKGIRKILKSATGPLKHQIDHHLSNMAENGILKVYSAPQSMAQQATHKFITNIQIPLKRTTGIDPFADS